MKSSVTLSFLAAGALAVRPFINEADTGIDDVLGHLPEGTLPNITDIKSLPDFEWAARRVLSPEKYTYFRGGAGGEWSYRNNLEVFQRYRFKPRALVDITNVENTLGRTVLGYNFSAPFFITSCGRAGWGHEDGELNFVKAAGQSEILYVPSMSSTKDYTEIYAAKEDDQVIFQQVYLESNLTAAEENFKKFEEAGAKALFYTVDSAADGNRVRAARYDVGSADSEYTYITWDHYKALQKLTKLPIVLKGIGSVEDVKLAIKHGAPAVYLSNHGARQLDGSPSALEVAIDIYEEDPTLFEQIEILADGGVRYGSDVLKLLALGVRAVGLGRSFLYANVFGEEGVSHAIDLLKHEIAIDSGNLGLPDVSKINANYVKWTPNHWYS